MLAEMGWPQAAAEIATAVGVAFVLYAWIRWDG